jgi:hypothetical protein
MIYACCKPERRDILAQQSPPTFNGIDFLEVIDHPGDPDSIRQRVLQVHFIHDLAPGQLGLRNVVLSGGERIPAQQIAILRVTPGGDLSPPLDPKILEVQVQQPGDFSQYTLQLVDPGQPGNLPPNIDPMLASIDFSFKVACQSDFDCAPPSVCTPAVAAAPDIAYLAKDYASFRQLMFDRMAKIMPQWRDRNAADIGTTLVEMIAYVGDYLSYQQDAVATEAYLGTARRRTSVRRHSRLVGYPMHDGRNSRTWVRFVVRADIQGLTLEAGAGNKLFTRVSAGRVMANPSDGLQDALALQPRVFELMSSVTLFAEHNQMSFYTWGDRRCCLPRGATSAWLRGQFVNLKPGDVLVFAEAVGPDTGVAQDADPTHRWAVRLTSVSFGSDPIGGLFDTPPNANPVSVTAIRWDAADASPRPLCLSSQSPVDSTSVTDVSVAYGNIALADDGLTIAEEDLPIVPAPNPALASVAGTGGDHCNPQTSQPRPPRFRPALARSPITFAEPYAWAADSLGPAASAVLNQRALDQLLPAITLTRTDPEALVPEHWLPRRDLLASHADSREFVVETENDGTAYLRFGDGTFGARPQQGTQLVAVYRIGNASAGNLGPDSLYHFATNDPAIAVDPTIIADFTNPLPAVGGLDPETLDQVRNNAPQAFRTQERAVTAADYGDQARMCDSTIQRAVGTFRWTGSWQTVFVTADRQGGVAVDDPFRNALSDCLERVRMAGHDVAVDSPQYVSLEIAMTICVNAAYFASDVRQALLQVLSNRVLPDGRLGAFHPDNFTFGQPVFLSPLYAIVQSTEGVDSVTITAFGRQASQSDTALKTGVLTLGRLEIARLDNDPNFPERGSLSLTLIGGR